MMARRALNADGSRGDWKYVTYAEALRAARSIGQALLNHGASAERPLAILSENSIEHALLGLGAMYVGVPYCSVSTAYSLVSQDYDKLKHVVRTITPGVVYAADLQRYGKAIDAAIPAETTEARILQDADRLEALGAVGLARMFLISGRMGGGIIDMADPMALRRPLESRALAAWAVVLGVTGLVYSAGWLVFAALTADLFG